MTQLLDDLVALRALIGTPERWTQRTNARLARVEGRAVPTSSHDAQAVCWCLQGGIMKVTEAELQKAGSRRVEVERALNGQLVGWEPPEDLNTTDGFRYIAWNDDPVRRHAEVVALVDRAIAAEEMRGRIPS
jgi:hypothetical protein